MPGTPTPPRTALLCVDLQRDFCEGGALPVPGGLAVARRAAEYLRTGRDRYALAVASRDWHQDPGDHFSPTPDFVRSWPPHCRAGDPGAQFAPGFAAAVADGLVDSVVSKGATGAAYSAFEGVLDTEPELSLAAALDRARISAVHVLGLATDHCVRATVLDSLALGRPTSVLLDLVAGVAPVSTAAALAELTGAGAQLRTGFQLPPLAAP